MNIATITVGVASAALLLPVTTIAQDDDEGQMIEITEIDLKPGHWRKFGRGMASYIECYREQGGEQSWSAWWDMENSSIHLVSSMDGWADMDTRDEASMNCWSVIEEEISPHTAKVETRFARSLPAWSGDAEGYDVVRLHQFRAEDVDLFSETVATVTGILREDEHDHIGTWYGVIGADSNEPNYFVVEHYENFAAMDSGRPSVGARLDAAVGEERADELWDQFGESLHDDWEYSTLLLSRSSDMGFSPDEE